MDSSTTATGPTPLRDRRTVGPALVVLVVLGLMALAFVAGSHYPYTQEISTTCDTTQQPVRCRTDDGLFLSVHDDGMWQDAAHVWRSGRPECLRGSGQEVGPVTLSVVSGGDDGLAWRQVAWVGCP